MARMVTESDDDFVKSIRVTEQKIAIMSHGTSLTSMTKVEGKAQISQGDTCEMCAFPAPNPMGGQAFMACKQTNLTANTLRETVTTLEE
jgi:hypothetical protein